MKVPLYNLSRQHIDLKTELINGFSQLIDNSEFTSGRNVKKFEEMFAHFSDTNYSLGVGSGSASLLISLLAAGIKPGDEVITTPLTFTATADAIVLIGAIPVFVDVMPDTGNIDSTKIEEKISSKTKAIIAVHLYGVPCEMNALVSISKKHSLSLIEDASHAHGSIYKKKKVGSFGSAGCFSLYPSKTLGAIGNAGVITSNSLDFIKRAKTFAHHGIKGDSNKYTHFINGYNELIDNVQASALVLKMPYLENWIDKKKTIAKEYNSNFKLMGHHGMRWHSYVDPSIYIYSIQIEEREKFQQFFSENGIETGVYYPIPLHLQKAFSVYGYKVGDFPNAELFAQQTVSLPSNSHLTDQEVSFVSSIIKKYFNK